MQQTLLTVILLARLARMRSARHDLDTLTTGDAKFVYDVRFVHLVEVFRFAEEVCRVC